MSTRNKAAEMCRAFAAKLARSPMNNHGPWCVVSEERWTEAAGLGWATAYIEVILPNGDEFDPGAVLYIAAEPKPEVTP